MSLIKSFQATTLSGTLEKKEPCVLSKPSMIAVDTEPFT